MEKENYEQLSPEEVEKFEEEHITEEQKEMSIKRATPEEGYDKKGKEKITRMTAYARPRALLAFKNCVSEGLTLKESVDATVEAYYAADAEYENGVKAHLFSKDKRELLLAEGIADLRQMLTAEEYIRVRTAELMYKKPLPADIKEESN